MTIPIGLHIESNRFFFRLLFHFKNQNTVNIIELNPWAEYLIVDVTFCANAVSAWVFVSYHYIIPIANSHTQTDSYTYTTHTLTHTFIHIHTSTASQFNTKPSMYVIIVAHTRQRYRFNHFQCNHNPTNGTHTKAHWIGCHSFICLPLPFQFDTM